MEEEGGWLVVALSLRVTLQPLGALIYPSQGKCTFFSDW